MQVNSVMKPAVWSRPAVVHLEHVLVEVGGEALAEFQDIIASFDFAQGP